jgi:glyoxylase-like metal-dependent hydrolase (beta-lactamase superfamily II)
MKEIVPRPVETGAVCDRVWAIRCGCVNLYVVAGTAGLICLDTGWRAETVRDGFRRLGLDVRDVAALFLTHGHWDHGGCAGLFESAAIHAVDPLRVARGLRARVVTVNDDRTYSAAGLNVRAFLAPGHSRDSACYLVDGAFLFTGDAVALRSGEARTFLTWLPSAAAAASESLRRLARLDGIRAVFTAHHGVTTDPACAFRRWREPEGSGR